VNKKHFYGNTHLESPLVPCIISHVVLFNMIRVKVNGANLRLILI
jgi:hypothetical protein